MNMNILIDDTLYVLLSNLYPSISGGPNYIVGMVIFALVATVLACIICWIIVDGVRRHYKGGSVDVVGRCIICFLLALITTLCGFASYANRCDYKKDKIDRIVERLKTDPETYERVKKIKSELVELNKEVVRYR